MSCSSLQVYWRQSAWLGLGASLFINPLNDDAGLLPDLTTSGIGLQSIEKASLCCTDQQPGAVRPPQRHLREANVLRPAKLEHAVQRGGSNGHLGRLPASSP